jgi:hypothetical protein
MSSIEKNRINEKEKAAVTRTAAALEIFLKAFFCCFEEGIERGDIYIRYSTKKDGRERKKDDLYLILERKKRAIEKGKKFSKILVRFL